MKKFMCEDFLLSTETAKILYHQYAEHMPIIDYHCHINPKEIYDDLKFDNITQAWLGGDHYKWRMMRSNGIDEKYITGTESTDKEKFFKFAEALPKAIGNPLYHWCHLELREYFGFDKPLSPATAEEAWNACNKVLQGDLSVRKIIEQSNVKAIGTTDDPIDSLQWHEKIRADKAIKVQVLPSYRPDKALNIDKAGFVQYIGQLGLATQMSIQTLDDVQAALTATVEKFAALGCRASDHGLDYIPYRPASREQVAAVFAKAMSGEVCSREETEMYKTELLLHLGRLYHKYDIVMQLHYSALRNPNTKMFVKLGPDTGFDCMASVDCIAAAGEFLNALELTDELPKTIIYSLNPKDNPAIASLIGAFQGTCIPGKIQHGSAWWFNDTKLGMISQMTTLADVGILGNFIGMLTDSRSFLSYTRHAYFRRILCDIIGTWVENGEYPNDPAYLGQMVQNICYNNAQAYFNLKFK